LTTACAALVASGKVELGGPPCSLTHPIVTGDRPGLALPEPSAYWAKFVTEPAAATAGAELDAAGPELAGAELAPEDAGAELELE